jgi:ATPase subunit of ABC transporter with duplicated ATPase domains
MLEYTSSINTREKKMVAQNFAALNDCVLDLFTLNGKTLRKHKETADRREAAAKAKQEKRRETSVKFDNDGNITSATAERLAVLENYRRQIEANAGRDENDMAEIAYDVNDTRLTRNLIAFATAMQIEMTDEE